MSDPKENVIEWLNEQSTVAVSFYDKKFINRVKKLKEQFPDNVEICAENNNGSIYAHLPRSAVKLQIKTPKEMSEEEKEVLRERMKGINANRLQPTTVEFDAKTDENEKEV